MGHRHLARRGAWLAAVYAAITFLYACDGPSPKRQEIAKGVDEVTDTISSYPIPTHSELIAKLQRLGVGYVIDVGHRPEEAQHYHTSTSRALYLGIFGADLSYAATYGVKSDVEAYLKAVKTLGDALNVRSERLEKAIGSFDALMKNDSIPMLVSEAVSEIYAYFCSNGQQEEATLFMAGGWVEASFIGTYIASLSQSNEEIIRLFIDQRRSYDMIQSYLSRYQQSSESQHMRQLLQELSPDFDALTEAPTNEELMLKLTQRLEYIRNSAISMPTP